MDDNATIKALADIVKSPQWSILKNLLNVEIEALSESILNDIGQNECKYSLADIKKTHRKSMLLLLETPLDYIQSLKQSRDGIENLDPYS